MLDSIFSGYFWHPLTNGPGYNFWSGIAGSFLTSVPSALVAALIFVRHKNCTTKGCWRLGHADPEHGHPVCRIHQSKLN